MLDIDIQIDQEEVKQLYLEKLAERMKEFDRELIFLDRKELIRRTSLSWNTILDTFFYDPRFPKYKVGAKWLFPAEETKKFLLQWLSEQPRMQAVNLAPIAEIKVGVNHEQVRNYINQKKQRGQTQ